VLFLDELPEFSRHVLEVLREPLESGRITISRAARQADFPARFQLVAAMNPCPCGFAGDPSGKCRCNDEQVWRYRRRISGPLLDRIDLHVDVPPLAEADLAASEPGEASACVRRRVERARERQLKRQGVANALLPSGELIGHARMDAEARSLLRRACARLGLSARAHDRVVKVARTIADLGGCAQVDGAHVAEALRFRGLDRRTLA
jgi:magnesium chelatase family protein